MLTSGLNLSDRTPTDAAGWPDFTYEPVANNEDALLVRRDDGALFTLRPEVPDVLRTLKDRGVLTGVISYNHEGNVRRILEAFGAMPLMDYLVGEWHSDKDYMLKRMLTMARRDGYHIDAGDALLVDDDPYNIYRGQCERMGAGFRCFGHDIQDLREVLPLAMAG